MTLVLRAGDTVDVVLLSDVYGLFLAGELTSVVLFGELTEVVLPLAVRTRKLGSSVGTIRVTELDSTLIIEVEPIRSYN